MHHFRKAGLPGQPIVYRSENWLGAKFDGGLFVGGLTTGSNISFWGLHVFSSLLTNRVATNTAGYVLPSGITADAPGFSLKHCLIENVGHPGIASWKGTRGAQIQGNIIRFVGFDDWLNYAGANRGSGMYLQNQDGSAEASIKGNISYFNYTTGMKAYGNTDIWKFTFDQNICAENNEAGIFFHQDNYASTNLTVRSNYVFRNGTGVRIGYPLGNGGHSNAVVVDNYSVDYGHSSYPFYFVDGWRRVTFTNNVGVSLLDRYVWFLEVFGEASGDVASHTMFGNRYFGTNYGLYGAGQFGIKETSYTLANWKTATGTDTDATHTYAMPTGLDSYVFRPSEDSNFVHVAAFNWPLSNSVTISLSGMGFNTGDQLQVFDAQNIPSAYKTEIYQGQPISLDLTLTNLAQMKGQFGGRSAWSGFDQRFRAFVIYRSDFASGTPTASRIGSGRSSGRILSR